ncbi:hypothetical protein [Paenibacillus sp. NPDC057967]|uniref:hypothetical protein n=1 Tax=Paenibacillus sp. NPDC057967 TaxID=3346293 RepID=UPI0036D7FF43
MITEKTHIDHRIVAGLRLVDNPAQKAKELSFAANGKTLFLSSIAEAKLEEKDSIMLHHWLEESLINLPPYESLIKILEAEGSEV